MPGNMKEAAQKQLNSKQPGNQQKQPICNPKRRREEKNKKQHSPPITKHPDAHTHTKKHTPRTKEKRTIEESQSATTRSRAFASVLILNGEKIE